MGATGQPLRGKSASERVSQREGFQRFFRGPPSQRQSSLSEALSPVALNRVAP